MKKNLKNYKVDFFDPNYVSQPNSIDFLNKVQSISIAAFEEAVLKEVQELHDNPALSDIDSLVIEFCQFVNLRAISTHDNYSAPPFIGKRAPLNSNKTYKENMTFFYQNKEGLNLFLHPIDFDALIDCLGSPEKLPPVLACKVEELERFCESTFYRKLWPQFSHVSINFDVELACINLVDIIPHLDIKYYQKMKAALAAEISAAQKAASRRRSYANASNRQHHASDEFHYDDNGENMEGRYDNFPGLIIKRKKNAKIVQENKNKNHITEKVTFYVQQTSKKSSGHDFDLEELIELSNVGAVPRNQDFLNTLEFSDHREDLIKNEELFPTFVTEVQEEARDESDIFKRLRSDSFKTPSGKAAQEVKKVEEVKPKQEAIKPSNPEDEIQMVFIKKNKKRNRKY